MTAGGTFHTNRMICIDDVMLPCLSQNHRFMISLMIMPKPSSGDKNYGVIMDQESMKCLDLDSSIRKGNISWGEQQIPMVPRNYWTEKNQKPERHESSLKILINQQ